MSAAAVAGLSPTLTDVAGRIAAIQARIDAATGGVGVGAGAVTGGAQPPVGTTGDGAEFRLADAAGVGRSGPVTTASRAAGASPPAPTSGPAPGAAAELAAHLGPDGAPWADEITAAADAAGIDPLLLGAVVRHESGFDPQAVSHAGAIGLAQLMPGTAAGLGVDPYDPVENLAGGARYLREQLDRFGHEDLALAAYNAGPNRVAEAGGVPRITETRTYVDRVMTTLQEWR